MQTLAILISSYMLNVFVSLLTNAGNEMEARLQTATSSLDVYSIISVQRLLDFIVPKCC